MYKFYDSPSHGWLRVPRQELISLGIAEKITAFSYQQDDDVYLEEDYDMSQFIYAKVGKAGARNFLDNEVKTQHVADRRVTELARYKF